MRSSKSREVGSCRVRFVALAACAAALFGCSASADEPLQDDDAIEVDSEMVGESAEEIRLGGQKLYAVTTTNCLVSFSTSDTCKLLSYKPIKGLQAGETVLGIDFRPSNGKLYALGSTSRIYTLDLSTGAATAVSATPFAPALEGTAFGFDFNPVVDLLRVVSNAGQNLRVNPNTGALAGVDGDLAYAAADANAGEDANVVGAAYTNPDTDPATATTLYDIDSSLDILATQAPPNVGTLNTVGSLGVDTSDLVGFDIAASGKAYAAIRLAYGAWWDGGAGGSAKHCGSSQLVTVDLATGEASRVGYIGTWAKVSGLAAPIPAK